jgi:hypothetical protein
MKRTSFRKRVMMFPTQIVRPDVDRQANFAQSSSGSRQPSRRRKIFVIKQTTRLPSTNGAGRKIRRVLIFDNHPDSLRLAWAERANPGVDLSVPQRVTPWTLVLISILILVALIGMFWPLFS